MAWALWQCNIQVELGLATVPIYSYNHIDYGCLLYKKIGPAGMGSCHICTVHLQLLRQQSWLQTVLKFQVSKFMNHKLNRNLSKILPTCTWTIQKQPYNWLSPHVNSDGTHNTLLYIRHLQVMVASPKLNKSRVSDGREVMLMGTYGIVCPCEQ